MLMAHESNHPTRSPLANGPVAADGEAITVDPAETEGPAAPPRPPAAFAGPRFQNRSLRLFRVVGIDVFIHWSWFLAALFQFWERPRMEHDSPSWHPYSSIAWYVAEYLALFGIVLLHEFGHALACRSVGGQADRIYLWPLGGIALVKPPQRPGPFLWSIAAGPLVNVLLVPVTVGLLVLSVVVWRHGAADVHQFLLILLCLNLAMLVLNLLPVYPLDGGQLLQGLLWIYFGRARSLLVVATLAIPGAVVLGMLSLFLREWVLTLIVAFILLAALAGMRRAFADLRIARAPRRGGYHCPACGTVPPVGEFWFCSRCRTRYDGFELRSICPKCGVCPEPIMCPDCFQRRPYEQWLDAAPTIVGSDRPVAYPTD
jgi:Zn-dependent protease